MPNQPDPQDKPAQEDLTALQKQLEEMKRSQEASAAEGKRLAAENKQLADANRALHLQAAGTSDDTDPDRAALEESGFDVDALDRYLTRRTREGTREVLRPVYNDAAARGAVPVEERSDAEQLLASDPEVNAAYQALLNSNVDPQVAGKFLARQVRAYRAEAGMHESANKVKEDRERDKADAGIMSGNSSAHATEDGEDAEQAAARRQALLKRAQAIGGFNKDIASELLKGKITRIDRMDEPPRVI